MQIHPEGDAASDGRKQQKQGVRKEATKSAAASREEGASVSAQHPLKQVRRNSHLAAASQDDSNHVPAQQPRRRRRGDSKLAITSSDGGSESSCGECAPPRRRRKPAKQSKPSQRSFRDEDAENRQPEADLRPVGRDQRRVTPLFQNFIYILRGDVALMRGRGYMPFSWTNMKIKVMIQYKGEGAKSLTPRWRANVMKVSAGHHLGSFWRRWQRETVTRASVLQSLNWHAQGTLQDFSIDKGWLHLLQQVTWNTFKHDLYVSKQIGAICEVSCWYVKLIVNLATVARSPWPLLMPEEDLCYGPDSRCQSAL